MKTLFSGVTVFIVGLAIAQADPFDHAKVTQTVQVVSLVDQQNGTQPARIGDTVTADTSIKTGADSRSELTFPDQTVLRLGPDAFFNFKSGGRSMHLENGTMLFSSPKGEGGGQVQAGSVTCSVTGTNFLVTLLKNGDVKMVVLEGKVVLYFTANPTVRREFKPGDMITVPEGDKIIGDPVTVDLKDLLASNPLLGASGFPPLYCEALLQSIANSQFTSTKGTPSKAEVKKADKALTAALGKPIAEATSGELAEASGKLAEADPGSGASVAAAIAGALDSSDKSKEAITAVITKLAETSSDSSFLEIVQASCAANPALAVTIAVAAGKAKPDLVVKIAYAAALGAPGQAVGIQDALIALFPNLADEIAAAIKKALSDILNVGIPGFTNEVQQNPGTLEPSPSPSPRSSGTPNPANTGGGVNSEE